MCKIKAEIMSRMLTLYTGGSAAAAADLVHQLKGEVVGYLFILEIPGLNGRDKLSAPTTILLENP